MSDRLTDEHNRYLTSLQSVSKRQRFISQATIVYVHHTHVFLIIDQRDKQTLKYTTDTDSALQKMGRYGTETRLV
jgi:hypothetical protein